MGLLDTCVIATCFVYCLCVLVCLCACVVWSVCARRASVWRRAPMFLLAPCAAATRAEQYLYAAIGDEMGTASNIKSRVNRQSGNAMPMMRAPHGATRVPHSLARSLARCCAVLAAITSAQQRLKLHPRVPPNGLVRLLLITTVAALLFALASPLLFAAPLPPPLRANSNLFPHAAHRRSSIAERSQATTTKQKKSISISNVSDI
jgi:hypothetical protein